MEIKMDGLVDVSKKVLYAGVGAVASVAEVTGKTIDKLSEKGEQVAKESKVVNKSKQAVKDMKENMANTKAAKKLQHALDSLAEMTKEERDAIKKRLEELEALGEKIVNGEEKDCCHHEEGDEEQCCCHHEENEDEHCCCHEDAEEEHCCCHEDAEEEHCCCKEDKAE